MKPVVLKSKFAQILGWSLIAVLIASAIVVGLNEGTWALLQTAAVAGFLALTLNRLLIQPHIVVSDNGVEIENPFRRLQISWGSIDRIDTKWGLAIYADGRKLSAWSAPAPGRHSSLRATKFEGKHLPESSYLAGTIRPGDLVSSDSGAAAYTIRSEWERRRDLGQLGTNGEVKSAWLKRDMTFTAAALLLAVVLNLS